LQLRNENATLQTGELELIPAKELPKNVLGYYRTNENEKLLVLINFSGREKRLQLDLGGFSKLLSTEKNIPEQFEHSIVIKHYSGIVYKVH